MKLSGEAWLEYGVRLHIRFRTVGTICVLFFSRWLGIYTYIFEAGTVFLYTKVPTVEFQIRRPIRHYFHKARVFFFFSLFHLV